MIVSSFFRLKNGQRQYFFNPENVLYIDQEGVLFAKDVYRMFSTVEDYDEVVEQLNDLVIPGIAVDRESIDSDVYFSDIDNVNKE